MSTIISPICQLVQSSNDNRWGELRVAQQKADDAIQKLRETGDSEVADVLLARYEELRKRSGNLRLSKEFPKVENISEAVPKESAKEAESQQTNSFEINLDHLEDGSLRFTLPPDETNGKPKVYTLSSPNFEKNNPMHNILIIAEEMVNTAINHIDRMQDLAESEMVYLTDMCEGFTSQRQKIDTLMTADGSPIALEVAAHLYLNDAFRFLQSVQMIDDVDEGLEDKV